MLWVLRMGALWADLPKRYGTVDTVSWRFYRRRQASVFDQVLWCLQADPRGELDWDMHFVDAIVVRSKDGFATELPHAVPLLDQLPSVPKWVVGDRVYTNSRLS